MRSGLSTTRHRALRCVAMSRRQPVLLDAIRLDRADAAGLAGQIHAAVRAMVLDGTLPPGARLPSSRVLAASWGLARNTVVPALDRLVPQGFLGAERGAGTFVAEVVGAGIVRRRAPLPPSGASRLSARGRASYADPGE